MPTPHKSQCRACSSRRRGEIDRRLIAGEPTRKVSTWLKSQGEEVSHVALGAHKRNHIEVVQEAKAKIAEEARSALEAGVEKLVADVNLLDVIAAHAMDAVKRLQPAMGHPTMPQSAAYTGALREAREAVKQRDEMLGGGNRDRAPAGERVEVHVHYPTGVAPVSNGHSPEPPAGAGASTPPARP